MIVIKNQHKINRNLKNRAIFYIFLTIVGISTIGCSTATTGVNGNTNTTNTSAAANNDAKPAENSSTSESPEVLIQDLYKTHDKDKGAIVQGKNRAILDKHFDKNLADLIWKDMTTNKGEVGVIDGDIFYNSQDAEIKNLKVGASKVDGDKASVEVTFENFKKKNTLVYSLVKEKNSWKISDINYGDGQTLLKLFSGSRKSDSKDSSSNGKFEGKYQIGETTCTVKPVKMAFEVKWEKGAGTEMFFSQGEANDKYIFSSDPPKGKANSFSFDDENYNTGIFYRADGKEFPIKRVK